MIIKRMKVTKRNGQKQELSLDRILYRLRKLTTIKNIGTLDNIDSDIVSASVIKSIHDDIKTSELDEEAARIAIGLSTEHPEYAQLASRIIISNMHKNTTECFSAAMELLYSNVNEQGLSVPLIGEKTMSVIRENKSVFNSCIDYNRDYLFDYFGYKTLERSYLLKIYVNNEFKIVERPQHMWLRVSIGIHGDDIESVLKTYELMSQFYFTHASPTLFNSGTPRPQQSSCFLLGIDDSMEGICDAVKKCALISKYAGGIGLHVSDIRAKGSYIKGTNGKSDGIVKVLKVFNEISRLANQGSKRNGSFAIYLEPWHADIEDFLELKKNSGEENKRARDLFYALWVCDAFMEAVEKDAEWYLMTPDISTGLTSTYGDEFTELYYKYVEDGKYVKKIKARNLWEKIINAQIENGMPYISYKDSVNKKSNQKNIGIIKSSNLCNEITLVSDTEETAVCNICTFSLSRYVKDDGKYDFDTLKEVVKTATKNMNKIIDNNFYSTREAEISNKRHRPIAMGVQGLANAFMKMKIPYNSEEARLLNKDIFETIQYAGWEGSMELAKKLGKTYDTYKGSPISEGIFQHNMWGVEESTMSGRWDWAKLRYNIQQHGVMNSMVTALPPTASTSQILGNYESFEPPTSNLFTRSTLSGIYPIINTYLIRDLIELNLWDNNMKQQLVSNNGSIQNIDSIPNNLKQIYKTIWEISQKTLIDLSADRAIFVDQTQSLNIHIAEPTLSKLSSMHFYGWKKGLKTGLYYLRSKPAAEAQKFTVDNKFKESKTLACSIDNKEECNMCSG